MEYHLENWLKEQNLIEIIDFGDLPVFKRGNYISMYNNN